MESRKDVEKLVPFFVVVLSGENPIQEDGTKEAEG